MGDAPFYELRTGMRLRRRTPPRRFAVGLREAVTLADCGSIELTPDEQVTFVASSGSEYDVVRKAWGYYATPSVNQRLTRFKLRAALITNRHHHYFVVLIERGKESLFASYCRREGLTVISWLDTWGEPCPICGLGAFETVFVYQKPPRRETRFVLTHQQPYYRQVQRCHHCGHFVSRPPLISDELYQHEYVDATYAGADFTAAYQRVMALPQALSDNAHRVKHIQEFSRSYFDAAPQQRTLLDVGSGLGVFVARMKQAGWACTALDPDRRAVHHARQTIGIKAVAGDYRTVQVQHRYDLVTFNKVLEHVPDPVAMLRRAKRNLKKSGVVYLEVPDGEVAARKGAAREEFFIDHWHVFSAASAAVLVQRAGFTLLNLTRLQEPSTKFTLRAFARPLSGGLG